MKYTTLVVGAVAIVACTYSTLCSAQSGTPSRQEVGNVQSSLVLLDEQPEVDDYARYLMVVDGMPHSEALAAAANQDHPDATRSLANR